MSDQPHVTPLRVYFAIFAALLVLTAVTVWVAFQHFGIFNDVIALLVAFTKATLVVLYFMHVKHATRAVRFVVVAGLVWLGLLLGITWLDYASQGFLG